MSVLKKRLADPVSDAPRPQRHFEALEPLNGILDSGEWIRDVIWDARRMSPGRLESDEEADRTARGVIPEDAVAPVATKSKLDPYNLSNDHLYEHTREARFRIRQTFGAIEVFHAQPAKDLQMPYVRIASCCRATH